MFLLADMSARIQNALILRRHSVKIFRSKFCLEVLKVLYQEGLILGYTISSTDTKFLTIFLKYSENKSFLKKIRIISTPGKKKYISYNQIVKLFNMKGNYLISTSRYGIVTCNFFSKNFQEIKPCGGELLLKLEY
jgi:ribosomal protein S8